MKRNQMRSFLLLVIFLLVSCTSQRQKNTQPPTATHLPPAPTPSSTTPLEPVLIPTRDPTPLPSFSTPHSNTELTPSPTQEPVTTLLFTGVIVPARCVQAGIDLSGNPDYPYEEVAERIRQASLAVGTLNATISAIPPHTGCVPTYVLVGGAENADALARAGFDAMSVATNHIKNCGLMNCGDRAFIDTLENLRRVGIQPIGAGNTHAEAMRPVVFSINGVRFGIVSLGQIEPMVFAGEDTPGIAVLNPDNLQKAIHAAREVSDVVIFMPHWGPEDVAIPNWIQRDLAQQAVQAGADLVVGNHTHVVQAVQELDGVPVFYGLGNFVFDQTWKEDHQQGVILEVRYQGKRYLGYELVPTHVDRDGRVHLAAPEEAREILQRIEEASQALK